jgi:hypothetical protein
MLRKILDWLFSCTDDITIEYSDATEKWYTKGERHRTDGPAVELSRVEK